MSNAGHILIIDDEAALRQTMARILQQAGFEVTTAENGEQGLSFIQTTNFDLIFMDLRMPGIAGWMRSNSSTQATQICRSFYSQPSLT